jgi:hypothetical protein
MFERVVGGAFPQLITELITELVRIYILYTYGARRVMLRRTTYQALFEVQQKAAIHRLSYTIGAAPCTFAVAFALCSYLSMWLRLENNNVCDRLC